MAFQDEKLNEGTAVERNVNAKRAGDAMSSFVKECNNRVQNFKSYVEGCGMDLEPKGRKDLLMALDDIVVLARKCVR